MKEFIIKLVVGMILKSISVELAVAAIEKLKKDLQDKVASTPEQWDDMAVTAFLSSEDEFLNLLNMVRELADEKVKESINNYDNIIWLPISEKIGEIISELKKEK